MQYGYIGICGVALGLGSGCVLGVEPPGAPRRTERPSVEEAPSPAPAACREPRARCRWSPGYWHWDGGREVWVPGRWELGNEGLDLVSDSQR